MTILQDARFALRGFRRNLGLTLVTVLVLGLGIGANTAIFSVVDALVLRPLPFPAPHELVAVPAGVMHPDFADVKARSQSFRTLAAYRLERSLLTAPGDAEMVNAVVASAELFSVLGVSPLLGRGFQPGEDVPGKPGLVVVSHGFWKQRLGGDAGVVGQQVRLDGRALTVIGVMPPAFRFPLDEDPAELWSVLQMPTGPEVARQWRGFRAFRCVGRLAPGVGLAQAQAEVAGIAAQLALEHPKDNAGRGFATIESLDRTVKGGRPALLVLLGAVAVVLLIACANVANLQLVRATARRRELAIRAALGAGRGRIIRQFLTESLVLAVLAAGLGVALAVWGVRILVALLPQDVPRLHAIGFDVRVLLYTLAAALTTAVVVGVAPALQASRTNLRDGLGEGDRGVSTRGRARAVLLLSEIALAVVLLVGAGLLVRSFERLIGVNPGFDPRGVLTARLRMPGDVDGRVFYSQLLHKLESVPGVRASTVGSPIPYARWFSSWNFTLDDRPPPPADDPWWVNARSVSPSYFSTLGIAVLQGRAFDRADDERNQAEVAVVNEAFVRRFFPQGSPLGRRLRAYDYDLQIVGVVADTRGTCGYAGCAGGGAGRLDRLPEPEVTIPLAGRGRNYFIAVRAASASTAGLIAPLRAAVQELHRNALLIEVRTMEEAIDESLDQRRLVMFLLGAFAVLAMGLAALGIYGVISYSVTQRTREIGIRMALGAEAGQVRRMVMGQGLRVCVLGLALGVVAALALTRVLASQLYGVSPADPTTYLGLSLLVLAVAAVASLVPARRATRIDPMIALRHE
jgi:putative ABC transport system permease protein